MTGGVGVYCALVHYPVRDRAGDTITTALTNLDVHDLARSARTWGLAGAFLVTPVAAQRQLIEGILEHWRTGPGGQRVPERKEALALCEPCTSVEAAVAAVTAREGASPWCIATAAQPAPGRPILSAGDVGARIRGREGPVLLLFGTGHGLAAEVLEAADGILAPIRPGGYNHLSVRAASAVIFDRLFGDERG